MMLSAIVRMKCPGTTAKIREYTRKEYEEVTEELAAALLIDLLLTIAAMCSEWTREGGSLNSLMEEHRTLDYGAVNLPVRVLFSHFLSFMRDKLLTPDLFCWPGSWMACVRASDQLVVLFAGYASFF